MKIDKRQIPFNKPEIIGDEIRYMNDAVKKRNMIAGNGHFTRLVNNILEKSVGCEKSLLTTSATSALEMIAILLNIKKGDEIIVPSFTFVTSVSAFVLRGATPVFADIRPDTLNIDESLIEKLITAKTKAIVVVHYAGISCEMKSIMKIAEKYGIPVVEDAAHAYGSHYHGKPLGSIGRFGVLSFHETKNIHCGEGGALLLRQKKDVDRAHIVLEKGTNRSKFLAGRSHFYTWVGLGSSFTLSDLNAAYLYGQLQKARTTLFKRKRLFNYYHQNLGKIASRAGFKIPFIPAGCGSNGHLFYILLKTSRERNNLMRYLDSNRIESVFHYIPLHNSPYGKKISKNTAKLKVTEDVSSRLLRLPLFAGMNQPQIHRVTSTIVNYFGVER